MLECAEVALRVRALLAGRRDEAGGAPDLELLEGETPDAASFAFEMTDVRERFAERGDLWAGGG